MFINRRTNGYIHLTLAMFYAGSTVIAAKYIPPHITVFLSQIICLSIAIVFITPLMIIKEGNPFKKSYTSRCIGLMLLQGLCGIFLFRIFLLSGLTYTTATQAGILTSMTPAILALFSVIFLKEKITLPVCVGIFICISGIVFLNIGNITIQTSGKNSSIFGNILVLLAVIGEVLFTIFRKLQKSQDYSLTTTFYVMLFSLIMFLFAGWREIPTIVNQPLSLKQWLPFVYYGLFCSALGYIHWFSGIARVPIHIATGFSGIMPVTSVFLSVIILKERLIINYIIGLMLTLVGIYIITSYKKVKEISKGVYCVAITCLNFTKRE